MDKESIIIIGGGIAGLIAARELCATHEVTLLEAAGRFGGRIHTIRQKGTALYTEAGAEFVHGSATETLKLLQEAKINTKSVRGEFYRKEGSELLKEDLQVEGWDRLMEQMANLEEDMGLGLFLRTYFYKPADQQLCKEATTFAEGFDLANVKLASVKALYQEWSQQAEDHRVEGGYGQLIDALLGNLENTGCKLLTSQAVISMEWEKGAVAVKTLLQTFTAQKCLITIPIGVLQNLIAINKPNFFPAIEPTLYYINRIGFGNVVKVVFQFTEIFWNADAGFFFADEKVPTWWTQAPENHACLTGWCGGLKADELKNCSDAEINRIALQSLANIFDIKFSMLEKLLANSQVFNWGTRPESFGAYSYATTNTAKALEQLASPVADTLYFAGEGYYKGPHPGTVEAAIVSARATVQKIIGR